MRYDYRCEDCGEVFEVEKAMSAPGPDKCPKCGSSKVGRKFGPADSPTVTYAGRPPWTYNDCLKYKDCRANGGRRTKVDPRKHGDLGAWNSPGEIVAE